MPFICCYLLNAFTVYIIKRSGTQFVNKIIYFRENDTWQCLLCMNFADIPESIMSEKKDGELSMKEKKIAERLVLEIYCQYDPSLPFREVIGPEVKIIIT